MENTIYVTATLFGLNIVHCVLQNLSTFLLGRLFWVDLIKWVSNVRPSVRPSIRTSVRPQKVSLILMKFGM